MALVRAAARRLDAVNEMKNKLELEVAECHISGNPGEAKNKELERITEAIRDVEGRTGETKKTIERTRQVLATLFNGLDLILKRLSILQVKVGCAGVTCLLLSLSTLSPF